MLGQATIKTERPAVAHRHLYTASLLESRAPARPAPPRPAAGRRCLDRPGASVQRRASLESYFLEQSDTYLRLERGVTAAAARAPQAAGQQPQAERPYLSVASSRESEPYPSRLSPNREAPMASAAVLVALTTLCASLGG